MNGPGGGCAPSPGSNGSVDPLASPNCDAAASAGTWRHKPPAAHVALGGSQAALRSPWQCQSPSLVHSAYIRRRTADRIIHRTAVYGPVRTVVWEGRSREAPPYPDRNDGYITRRPCPGL